MIFGQTSIQTKEAEKALQDAKTRMFIMEGEIDIRKKMKKTTQNLKILENMKQRYENLVIRIEKHYKTRY